MLEEARSREEMRVLSTARKESNLERQRKMTIKEERWRVWAEPHPILIPEKCLGAYVLPGGTCGPRLLGPTVTLVNTQF